MIFQAETQAKILSIELDPRGVIGEQAPVPPPRRRRPRKEVAQKTVIPITGGLGSQSQDSRAKIQNSQNRGRFVQSLQISGDSPGFYSTRITRGSMQEETTKARTHDIESFSFRGSGVRLHDRLVYVYKDISTSDFHCTMLDVNNAIGYW